MDTTTWGLVQNALRDTVGDNNYATWIEPLEFIKLEDGVAFFHVATNFTGDWVQRHFAETIIKAVGDAGHKATRLRFDLKPVATKIARTAPKPQIPAASSAIPGAPLDTRFTFEKFVVGKPNELAHAAARRVAEGGEVSFNPLFLYGGVGLGKTHISADRAPGEIKGLEDRIKSRLQSGLVVDLHPTDYELRLGILQQKTEQQKILHPEVTLVHGVIEFLAHRISTNVRVLEGALMRLFAFASLVGKEINLDLTQECLADILREADRKVTIEEIQRKVSEHFNIRLSDLIGPRRVRTLARPRQMAMYLSKQLTARSLPEIGRRFGGRDHTTVMHGVRKIEELKGTDSQIAEDLELLRRALEA